MSRWPVVPSFGNINTHLISYTLSEILNIINAGLRRERLPPASDSTEQTSLFLRLPPEMRQAIYEAAILDDSDDAESMTTSGRIGLLRTCRQVKLEAEPIRYQRPQSFSSQAKLFDWLDHSDVSNLKRVHTLSLHLTDVDLSVLVDPSAINPRSVTTAWAIYQDELGRLDNALRSLPSLSNLTVIPPKDNRSMLLRQFYRSFLTMIWSRCPKLQRLEIHDSMGVLKYAPMLDNVRKLIFTEAEYHQRTVTSHDHHPREVVTPARIVKIERDDVDGWHTRPRCSPRPQRRSRVTRVVSD